jgi:hypothetical protein
MGDELLILTATAASIAFIHTLIGPDHYLPFIAMGRARGWSLRRTLGITAACGLAHVAGSVALGMVGVALGLAIGGLTWIEGVRGQVAGWLLIGFGVAYMAWGLRQAWRNRPHTHVHAHGDGTVHEHRHTHHSGHVHVHEAVAVRLDGQGSGGTRQLVPWVLFTIFVFGPCEPLIPLLMYPAAERSWVGVGLVSLVFGAVTVVTMLGAVLVGQRGLSRLPLGHLERYVHAMAGFAIIACGAAIQLGL